MRDFYSAAIYIGMMDDLAPSMKNRDVVENGRMVKALVYQEAEQYDLAIQTASQFMQENHTPRRECFVRSILVESSYNSGANVTDRAFLDDSIEFCSELGELFPVVTLTINKANYLVDEGNTERAVTTLENVEEAALESNYPRLIAHYYSAKANALYALNSLERAERNGLLTLQFSQKAEFNKPAVSAYLILSKVEKAKGNFETALQYHELFFEADTAYNSEQQANKLAFQRAKFEAELSDQTLKLMSKENQLLAAEAKTSRQEAQNSVLVALFAITALSIAFYWLYRTNKVKKRFKALAETDGLTGLNNRREFCNQALSAIKGCRKNAQPISFLILDLDHFKTINDTYGHAVGDEVLKLVSTELKHECRNNDIVGRLGGEEFGIVLPGCTGKKAMDIANTLREKSLL